LAQGSATASHLLKLTRATGWMTTNETCKKVLRGLNEELGNVRLSDKCYDGMTTIGNRSYHIKASEGKLAVSAVRPGDEASHLAQVRWREVQDTRPSNSSQKPSEEKLVQSRKQKVDGNVWMYNDLHKEVGSHLQRLRTIIEDGCPAMSEAEESQFKEKVKQNEHDMFANLDHYGIVPMPQKGLQDPAFAWIDPYERASIQQQTWLLFSASSTPTGNVGQANYTAANAYLDGITYQARQDRSLCSNPITMMWGAVAGIGMRWKAFATVDFLNATPEVQFSIEESANVLLLAFAVKDIPEWWGMMPPVMREVMLTQMGQAPKGYDQELLDSTSEDPLGVAQTYPRASKSRFTEGTRVRLTDLQKNPAMNGRTGTLQEEVEQGKWRVTVDGILSDKLVNVQHLELLALSPRERKVIAAGPKPPAKIYSIAGTWDDWVPHDMNWDWNRHCFVFRIELGRSGQETFQITVGKAQEKKWKTKGQTHTIGAREKGVEGDVYEVTMPLMESGSCKSINWTKVDSHGAPVASAICG